MTNKWDHIFFVGIKGVAMANLAVIARKMGKKVYGADTSEEFITDRLLADNKITYLDGFNHVLPASVKLVVYSAAHGGTGNKYVREAVEKNVDTISQAEYMGALLKEFKTVFAVTGCHGKTTTSSLLAFTLHKLGVKPSYSVGVPYFTGHQGADFQSDDYFVVEADEYGINPPADKTPKFLKLDPEYVLCTNIDFDHPDVYTDLADTKKAFLKFFTGRKTVLNIDDGPSRELSKKMDKNNFVTYGVSDRAKYRITDIKSTADGSEFSLTDTLKKKKLGIFKLSIFGRMNIQNAAGVVSLLNENGFAPSKIRSAIRDFTGPERRFQRVFKNKAYDLIDDYAHHPAEIKATILTAKETFKDRRIVVIFQPHTYTRTVALLPDFAGSLDLADTALLLPIFASAREDGKIFRISSLDIAAGSKKASIRSFEGRRELINAIDYLLNSGDVVITMGAGDVYKLKTDIVGLMEKHEGHGLNIVKNKDLFPYLTLRTHTRAEYFLEAEKRHDLIGAFNYAKNSGTKMFLIGGGSNLAITSDMLPGLIVKNSYRDLRVLSEDSGKVIVSVSSGLAVSMLIARCLKEGWEGFEYHQGLPGTVGGALYMNSKWTRPLSYFGDSLLYAYLIDKNGKVKKADRKYFKFAYDYSVLQKTGEILLEAVFSLKKSDPSDLKKKAGDALAYRKKTQPFGIASSGCFFRNITAEEKEKLNLPTRSAGYLIDKSGLKNFSVGAFYVSPIHANFIINRGGGKREDLIKILSVIKRKVKENFHVNLEEEVIII